MGAVGADVGQHGVGEQRPPGGLALGGVARDGSQARHTGEAGVGPVLIVEFPEPGIGLPPAGFDGADAGFDSLPVVGAEVVVAGGRGEEQQRLTECVELELVIDPVPDLVESARVTLEMGQDPLVGHRPAIDPVGRFESGAVREDPLGHKSTESSRSGCGLAADRA